MTTYEALEAHLASPEFRQRFIYHTAPRQIVSADEVDARQLGHMLESLTDAMVFMRRISDNPQIDVTRNPTLEPHTSSSPGFMDEFVQDPRTASSFARSDMPIPRIKRKTPVTELADDLHVIMRRQGNAIGNAFVMPPGLEPLFEAYAACIRQYKELVRQYGDHSRVPEDAKQCYTEAYSQVADQLFAALRALPVVSVIADSKLYTVPNDMRVNERQPDSCPALVLFALRSIGKEGIDRNRRPPAEFRRISDIVGVESLISDTTQGLLDHIERACGAKLASCDLNRTQLKEAIRGHTRDLQLTLAFCRVADCGYKALYDDLALFIRMAGEEPALDAPRTPREAAILLHAVERRFAREGIGMQLQAVLRGCAIQMSHCPTMVDWAARFSQDMEFRRILTSSRQLAAEHGLSSAVAMLDTFQQLLQPSQGMAGRIAAQRSRSLPPDQSNGLG